MHVSEQNRCNKIEKLPIREELKQLFLGKLELGPFEESFYQPDKFYSQGWPDSPGNWDMFPRRKLLPLWEHYERIYAYDLNSQELILFYVECPEEFKIKGSLDSAIFDMIDLHVWEYGGGEEGAKEALAFAKAISFPKLSELECLLTHWENTTRDQIQNFHKAI